MTEQLELFKGEIMLKKKKEKRTSGLHMEVELYDRAAALGEQEGMSTNAVLVQLIEIGLDALEAKGSKKEG